MDNNKNVNELSEEAMDNVTGGAGNFRPTKECGTTYLCDKCKTATPWDYNANGEFACTVCGGTKMGTLRVICPIPMD